MPKKNIAAAFAEAEAAAFAEPVKLTAAEVTAAVDYYNAHNAAAFDYLHTIDGGKVFRRIVTAIPRALCVQSVDSETGAKVIRMKADKVHKFVMEAPEYVCEAAELDAIRAQFPAVKNYGDAVEHWYKREHCGATTWVKDSTKFWVAGDIRLDGVEVQIKFGGARLAAYSCLHD